MAKKDQQTAKRAAPSKARKPAKPRVTLAQLERELKTLKSERDDLRTELKVAKQRIGELEALNDDAVNRIDWVLDSLHSLIEK